MNEIQKNLQKKNDLVSLRLKGRIPPIYKDTMCLYFLGMDYKAIAKALGISETAANTRLTRLRKQGLIGKKQTKTETVMELLKIGINDNNQIAELLNISYSAASKLKSEANIQLKKYEENLGVKANREIDILNPELIPEIKEMLSYRYPIEIANAYGVSVREIYNVIYSLSDQEKMNIKRKGLKQNNLYKRIKYLKKNENMSTKEAVDKIFKEELSFQDRIDLARIYYIYGKSMRAQRILTNTAYDKTVSIGQRIIAREEADKMYFNDVAKLVRRDYVTRKPDGKLISFKELREKYKVGSAFLTEVIGPEDEIDSNDFEL